MVTEEVATKNKEVSKEMVGQNMNEEEVERRFNANLENSLTSPPGGTVTLTKTRSFPKRMHFIQMIFFWL